MRQVSFIGGLLGIVLVGCCLKWALSQSQAAAMQAAQKEARKASLDAGYWKYPGSNELARGDFYARWTTGDDLDKVTAYYGKLFHYTKLTSNKPGGSAIEQQDRWTNCLLDDSVEAYDSKAEKNPARPVSVRIFVEHGPWHTITLVVSRAKEETHTHIAMTYCNPVRPF